MAVEPGADDAREPRPVWVFRTERVACAVEALEGHAALTCFGEDTERRFKRDAAVV